MKWLLAILAIQGNAMLVVNESNVVVYLTPEQGGHVEDVLRYGFPVTVTEEKDEWAKVSYPGWQGWLQKKQLLEISDDLPSNAYADHRGAYVFGVADTEWGPILYLPFESPVHVIEEVNYRWLKVQLLDGRIGFVQRSHVSFERNLLSLPEMVEFSHRFLGINYIYGGTTSHGYDCSGFVQMLYRQMGITLPRNSSQQAADARFSEVTDPQAGDLVFFFNGSGKVVHVAMMINSEEFIHSFTKQEAWVCIGKLADEKWRNGQIYYGVSIKRM